MVKVGSTMAQIANKKMAWKRFVEPRLIWDTVPAIIANSWGQSWSRVNFSKELDSPYSSLEHFISVQVANSVAANGFTETAVYPLQWIAYDDQNC